MSDSVTFQTPFKIGDVELKNRVVMAPCTRNRADMDLVPTDRDAETSMLIYYEQRTDAGERQAVALIIYTSFDTLASQRRYSVCSLDTVRTL